MGVCYKNLQSQFLHVKRQFGKYVYGVLSHKACVQLVNISRQPAANIKEEISINQQYREGRTSFVDSLGIHTCCGYWFRRRSRGSGRSCGCC